MKINAGRSKPPGVFFCDQALFVSEPYGANMIEARTTEAK
jgi:hypothetical protein